LVSCHQNGRFTGGENAHEALRAAAGLRALGLGPGDRAGVWATNCFEWAALQSGWALPGMGLGITNPPYRRHEMSFVLRRSKIKVLFLHAEDRRTNYRSILEESRASQELELDQVLYLNSPDWAAFLREPDGHIAHPDPDEPANMQYASGT